MVLGRALQLALLFLGSVGLVSGLYSAKSDVIQLTEANFKEKVLRGDGVWIVEFYAPWCGHCRSLVSDWDKAATALKGVVNVAAVDATVAQSLASKYQIQGFPTIKVFGADKRKPTDYQGARSADAIVDAGLGAARKLVKERLGGGGGSRSSSSNAGGGNGGQQKQQRSSGGSSDVVELTQDNFRELVLDSQDVWLIEFFAPWCGHCKKLAPEWEDAARKLKGLVKVGAVDATVHTALASEYGVRGYPTIKTFPAAPKKPRDAADYNGPREAGGIVEYALNLLDKADGSAMVQQLTSPSQFEEACSGQVICLLAALPHIVESGKAGRDAYLETLGEAAKKLMRAPVRLLWSEGGAQPQAETALGLTFGFPAIAALRKDKGVFATLKGSFSADSINNFMLGLTSGREATSPLNGGIVIKQVQPWDGNDAQVEEEEEFSLDEIMAEEL